MCNALFCCCSCSNACMYCSGLGSSVYCTIIPVIMPAVRLRFKRRSPFLRFIDNVLALSTHNTWNTQLSSTSPLRVGFMFDQVDTTTIPTTTTTTTTKTISTCFSHIIGGNQSRAETRLLNRIPRIHVVNFQNCRTM